MPPGASLDACRAAMLNCILTQGMGFVASTTEDYGHNGVVKWMPKERLLIVVLSDIPEPKANVPAPSRALGELLETLSAQLR